MQGILGKRIRNAAIGFAAIAIVAWLSFSWSRQAGIAELRGEAENRLKILSAALFAPTDKHSHLPELVSNHPLVVDFLVGGKTPATVQKANQFLFRLNESAKSAVVYLMDINGLVLASSNWKEPLSFVGRNYAFRPYFQDALHKGTGKFYAIGATTFQPGYFLSHAVFKDGVVVGVAVVKVDISNLDAGWDTNKDEMTVVDDNGVIFLSSQKDWKYRPSRSLDAAATEQLKKTRQYDTVLKSPLKMELMERLSANEQIVRVERSGKKGEGREQGLYFVRSGPLEGSKWANSIFISMDEINARSVRNAIIVAGALGLMTLGVLYLRQTRRRVQDKERSRLVLEQAHLELERKHQQLQQLSEDLRLTSITDPLTGAYNRRFFMEAISKLISSANRHNHALSVIMIDVDHFKNINDQHGHPAGDAVLQALTATCKEELRGEDIFARFGGEEFVMALFDAREDDAQVVAERLRFKIMNRGIAFEGLTLQITISIGISGYRRDEPNIESAIKRADEALYAAKNSGRNQVVVRL